MSRASWPAADLLLVHDERLLALVDTWLAAIPDDAFLEALPLLRRTFGTFASPERRSIGDRARALGDPAAAVVADDNELDSLLAASVCRPSRDCWGCDDAGRRTHAALADGARQRGRPSPSPVRRCPPPTAPSTPRSRPCTTPSAASRGRNDRPGSVRRLRALPAGSAISAQYFPSTVVQVMQRDAVERLGITRMLMEPELLNAVEPDVHLVSTLLALNEVMPEETKQTAREVVGRVVAELETRLAERTRAAVTGALDRAGRTGRPRHSDIDWDRTIRANLKHFSPTLGTIVPDRLVGYARRNHSVQRDVVLAIDQSGSMAESVVYASVFGAVLGSMRALRTSLVVFDTAVVDLTDELDDPVDVLFGTQLGGGTDINRARRVLRDSSSRRPGETVMVLISDLYEGGIREELLRRARILVESGVQLVALLALSDSGTPSYDAENAAAFADLGVPTFACTPDLFPDLMATAIRRDDISQWAATDRDIVTNTYYQGW